jgi:hypothetical protein
MGGFYICLEVSLTRFSMAQTGAASISFKVTVLFIRFALKWYGQIGLGEDLRRWTSKSFENYP